MVSNDNLRRMIRAYKRSDLIITPVVEQWLVHHPEGIILDQDDIDEWLAHLVMAEPRDRMKSWSASARGTCLRKQVFTYIGFPQSYGWNSRLQNIFNDGQWRHIRWQMMLWKAGLLIDLEVPVYHTGLNLVGTMDGEGADFGFELKGIWSLAAIRRNGGNPISDHVQQINSYFLCRPDLKRFALIYEDKQTQEWQEFIIEPDSRLMNKARRELRHLNQAALEQKLPAVREECRDGKGTTFKGCPYNQICLGTRRWPSQESIGNPALQSGGGKSESF